MPKLSIYIASLHERKYHGKRKLDEGCCYGPCANVSYSPKYPLRALLLSSLNACWCAPCGCLCGCCVPDEEEESLLA